MDLSSIPPSPMKGIVNIVVEIPAGSRNKYEYCSDAGIMALDRVLHSSCLLYTSDAADED